MNPNKTLDPITKLQRENERLLAAFENKTLECVGLKTANEQLKSTLWTSNESLVMANESLAESRKLVAELNRESDKLKAQLAATEEALAQVQRESARLREECETRKYRATVIADTAFEARYEAMRKVCEAAAGLKILRRACREQPYIVSSFLGPLMWKLIEAEETAIAEYRELQSPLSPAKQAVVDAALEKVGEMEENAL